VRILFAACAALVFATSANAATHVNGSFETGIDPAGSTLLATDDTTSITGWTVLAEGIDFVDSSVWLASNGSRSLDLSGLTTGGILQWVTDLTIGQRHRVKIDLSGNPLDTTPRPKDKRLLICSSGNGSTTYAYSLTDANTPTIMLYQTVAYDFVAIRNSQPIRLQSLVSDQYGAVIDNVRISAAPEFSSWLMMLAGFGIAARRGAQVFCPRSLPDGQRWSSQAVMTPVASASLSGWKA